MACPLLRRRIRFTKHTMAMPSMPPIAHHTPRRKSEEKVTERTVTGGGNELASTPPSGRDKSRTTSKNEAVVVAPTQPPSCTGVKAFFFEGGCPTEGDCAPTSELAVFLGQRAHTRETIQAIVTPINRGRPRNHKGPKTHWSKATCGKRWTATKRPANPVPLNRKETTNSHQNKLRCIMDLSAS